MTHPLKKINFTQTLIIFTIFLTPTIIIIKLKNVIPINLIKLKCSNNLIILKKSYMIKNSIKMRKKKIDAYL
jgi:hypothetical protein